VLCLEPIVLGIWLEKNEQITATERNAGHKMYFGDIVTNNRKKIKQQAVAVLELDLLNKIKEKRGY
jgi:hypothetical protein